jgi:excisionase family DNA binding protein
MNTSSPDFDSKLNEWLNDFAAQGGLEDSDDTRLGYRVKHKGKTVNTDPPVVIVVLESPRLYLTIDEAATYLRCSRRTIYTMVDSKEVRFTRVRGEIRFRLQWLNEYLDNRTVTV